MTTEQINKLDKCRDAHKQLNKSQGETRAAICQFHHGANSDYGRELSSLTDNLKKEIEKSFENCRKEIDNLIKNI